MVSPVREFTQSAKTNDRGGETHTATSQGTFSNGVKRLVIGIIKVVIYIVFVAAAIYFTPKILAKVMGTEYPLATITSGSMWPVLKINNLILMKGITGGEAEIGQIIVYQNASQGFTIHRLIRKEKNGMLVTKGDANSAEDPPISEKDVIGRIVSIGTWPFHIPYLGIIARKLGPKVQEFEF